MTLSKKDKEFIKKIEEKYNKELEKDEKKKLARETAKYFEDNYKNLRTVTTKITLAKKKLRLSTKDFDFYKDINPKREITKEVIKMNQKVLDKETTFTKINKSWMDDIIKKFRKSNNIKELAVYILLNTGRRMNELINGEFTSNQNCKNKIFFKGILKKRDKDLNEFICIDTIDSKDNVLNAVEKFKSKIKGKKKLSIQRNLQNGIKELTHPFHFTSHFLRVAYANYLFQFRNPEQQIFNAFIKKVLNHASLLSSINYTSIEFVDDTK